MIRHKQTRKVEQKTAKVVLYQDQLILIDCQIRISVGDAQNISSKIDGVLIISYKLKNIIQTTFLCHI